VESHIEELSERKKRLRLGDIEKEEASKLNTATIIQFHEKLTKFLKASNIRT